MPASFVTYVDESGDEGFVFKPDGSGSTRWFVLACAITRKSLDLQTVRLVNDVRRILNYEPRKPLHFRHMRHEHRVAYIDRISQARVRVVAVAIHKPSLTEPEKFQQPGFLYRYAARMLLERMSWCCRDHRNESDGDGKSEIIFSNRSATSYAEMRDYFDLLKLQNDSGYVSIDWSVIDPHCVRPLNHEQCMGLQIADAVASGFFYGLQANPQGFTEPRYAMMLRSVVYSHKKNRIGNGLKLYPREAIDSCVESSNHSWVAMY